MIDTHYVSELFISDMVVSCGIRLFSGILVGFYHNEVVLVGLFQKQHVGICNV